MQRSQSAKDSGLNGRRQFCSFKWDCTVITDHHGRLQAASDSLGIVRFSLEVPEYGVVRVHRLILSFDSVI